MGQTLTMTRGQLHDLLARFAVENPKYRQALISDKRADLDLHINLLAEHEITRILTLVDAIADHFGIEVGAIAAHAH